MVCQDITTFTSIYQPHSLGVYPFRINEFDLWFHSWAEVRVMMKVSMVTDVLLTELTFRRMDIFYRYWL